MVVNIERRKQKRITYEAFISHDILSDEITHTDKMCNFSRDGLYFESNQNIHPGEDIYIGIGYHPHLTGDDTQLLFGVEVVWRRELKNSQFRYGFGTKFINSSNSLVKEIDIADSLMKKAEMTKFEKQSLSETDLKDQIDSRKHPRKPCKKLLIFTYKNQHYKGLVTNISRGGAFIETGKGLLLGEIIYLVVLKRKSHKDLRLKGWIVRLSPNGIGVSFERRSGVERRYDLDRRTGLDRRSRSKRPH